MVSSKLPKLLKLNSGDSGSIFFFQNKYFLKKTKRIFIINQKKKKIRGNHAHKKAFQFLIAVNKKISFTLYNGKIKKNYNLNKLKNAILIPPMTWLERLQIPTNGILLVMTNEYFNENEYIRNIKDYENTIK
jgi:hypothetical protein